MPKAHISVQPGMTCKISSAEDKKICRRFLPYGFDSSNNTTTSKSPVKAAAEFSLRQVRRVHGAFLPLSALPGPDLRQNFLPTELRCSTAAPVSGGFAAHGSRIFRKTLDNSSGKWYNIPCIFNWNKFDGWLKQRAERLPTVPLP